MTEYFYTASGHLVDSDVNISFNDAFTSSEQEFDDWAG